MNIANVKQVINSCVHYYDILEEKYEKDDTITEEILNYYKFSVVNTDFSRNEELLKIMRFDESVYAYFNDLKFHDMFLESLSNLDEQINLEEFMLSIYDRYKNDLSNKVTTTKWI